MTYQPLIPNPGDYLAESQPEIRTNFNLLNTYFGINHVEFDAAGDNGKHIFATFIQQGVHPAGDPATIVDEVAVYAKELTYGAPPVTEETLYLRKENNGTVIQISGPDPIIADPGSTYLAGGIIIKWGFGPIGTGAAGTVLGFASPFPNNCWEVIITPQNASALYASVLNKTVANFTSRANVATTIGYIAIGN